MEDFTVIGSKWHTRTVSIRSNVTTYIVINIHTYYAPRIQVPYSNKKGEKKSQIIFKLRLLHGYYCYIVVITLTRVTRQRDQTPSWKTINLHVSHIVVNSFRCIQHYVIHHTLRTSSWSTTNFIYLSAHYKT